MASLSWSFLPAAGGWLTAVLLSAVLAGSAAAWMWCSPKFKQKTALGHMQRAVAAIVFVVFIILWWAFGFTQALWPLRNLDEFARWARASSYVLVPLWIGGIAWAAALLLQRLVRVTSR